MWAALASTVASAVVNVAAKWFLAWISKREANAETAARIEHVAKAAAIIAARVPNSAAADALDKGGI